MEGQAGPIASPSSETPHDLLHRLRPLSAFTAHAETLSEGADGDQSQDMSSTSCGSAASPQHQEQPQPRSQHQSQQQPPEQPVHIQGEGKGACSDDEHLEAPSHDEAAQMQIPRPEERKRVKVYELRDSDWFDRGTGMCYADTSEENPMIVVESEERPGTMLLETKVMRKDVYQKQQETLIVWTDVSGTDLALSFQEAGGCASMWNFVSSFQTYFRNSNPDDSVSDDALDELTTPITLPSPSLGNLPEIERIISAASSPMQGRGMLSRDTLSRYILQKDYLARLVPLVAEAEDFEDLEDLHRLCNIMKMIILLNDNAIVEAAVSDELWEGVVGALEYDPDFPTQKANHRQYLSDGNRYKEVVPIQDPDIRNKIRCTWRLQYLKDVVLARIIDDPTYSVLNSLIFFNQVAIVQHLQHSPTFMRDVFELFRQDDVQRKEDAIRFLYQCTLVAKNLQPPGRSALYLDFVGHGVFDAITFALSHHKSSYRATGVDVLMSLLDHDQGAMREHLLLSRREQSRLATDRTQSASKSPIWITDILVNLLHTEQDLGVKMQASDAIKVLLEPIWFFGEPLARPLTAAEIERVEQAEETGFVGGSDTAPSATQEPTLESLIMRRRFDVAMVRLFSPLRGLSRDSLSRLSLQQSAMYEHLLDILSCFIRSHVFWGKRFMYSQGLMARVAMLLDAPQKHLQLAALQTVRTLLFLNDTFYFGEMSQHNIYGRLLGIITATMPRDNLLSSACLELFESVTRHMTNQNAIAKPVVLHLGAAHRQTLCSINHVDTFHKILRKFDWLQGYAEPLDLAQLTATDPDALSEGAWARVKGPRVIAGGQSAYQGLPEDPAQEEYFEGNDDDEEEEEEEEEDEAADVTSPPKQQQSSLSRDHSSPKLSEALALQALLGYDETSDWDDDETSSTEAVDGDSDSDEPKDAGSNLNGATAPSTQEPQPGKQAEHCVTAVALARDSLRDSDAGPTASTKPAPTVAAPSSVEQFAAIARGLAEKRRREANEDDDDELVKLRAGSRKRSASGAGITSQSTQWLRSTLTPLVTKKSPAASGHKKPIVLASFGGEPLRSDKRGSSPPKSDAGRTTQHTGEDGCSSQPGRLAASSGLGGTDGRREHGSGGTGRSDDEEADDNGSEHADESATVEPLDPDEQEHGDCSTLSPSSQDAVRIMESLT